MEYHQIEASSDNLKLSVMTIEPADGIVRAVLQLVHGMCEHKERYAPFMEYMAEHGYACVIHDHRGHGHSIKSMDDLGYFYEGGASAMVEDIRMVNNWIRDRYPDHPIILFGHSMGSMAVRAFTRLYDDRIDGLIVCGSPSYNPAAPIGKLLAGIDCKINGDKNRPAFIQKIAMDGFNSAFKHEGRPNAWVCSDKDVVDAYNSNPLCNFQFTSNGFLNLFTLMQSAYNPKGWKLSDPDLPVLFMSGEKDPCLVDLKQFGKAVNRMKKAGYTNVKVITWPGMRHEILNEKGKEKVWKKLRLWCDEALEPVK